MWPVNLSVRLPVIALVGRYPTNKLIGRRLLREREVRRSPLYLVGDATIQGYPVLVTVSSGYPGLSGGLPTHYSPFRRSVLGPKPQPSLDLHA